VARTALGERLRRPAPTPASAHAHAAPVLKARDWTATPSSPVSGSRPTIEYVTTPDDARWGSDRLGERSAIATVVTSCSRGIVGITPSIRGRRRSIPRTRPPRRPRGRSRTSPRVEVVAHTCACVRWKPSPPGATSAPRTGRAALCGQLPRPSIPSTTTSRSPWSRRNLARPSAAPRSPSAAGPGRRPRLHVKTLIPARTRPSSDGLPREQWRIPGPGAQEVLAAFTNECGLKGPVRATWFGPSGRAPVSAPSDARAVGGARLAHGQRLTTESRGARVRLRPDAAHAGGSRCEVRARRETRRRRRSARPLREHAFARSRPARAGRPVPRRRRQLRLERRVEVRELRVQRVPLDAVSPDSVAGDRVAGSSGVLRMWKALARRLEDSEWSGAGFGQFRGDDAGMSVRGRVGASLVPPRGAATRP
jgi:hypothetical protein